MKNGQSSISYRNIYSNVNICILFSSNYSVTVSVLLFFNLYAAGTLQFPPSVIISILLLLLGLRATKAALSDSHRR